MIASELEALVRPILEADGFELVECSVSRLQRSQIFRVSIDHEEGIPVDACARMSRRISHELDENPMLRGAYRIEVSSPGMNRPVRSPEHFRRFRDETVRLEFVQPEEDGARHLTGRIGEVEGDGVWIEPEGGDARWVAFEKIRSGRLRIDPWKKRPKGTGNGD